MENITHALEMMGQGMLGIFVVIIIIAREFIISGFRLIASD